MRANPFAALRSLFVMSDEQAMQRIQNNGDEYAFAHLVGRWEGPIQRLCVRMTGDAHGSQDLAQETFVRVFARRGEYRPNGKFSTWLWRIALNLCYDELRRRGRRDELSLHEAGGENTAKMEDFASAEPAPDESLTGLEQQQLVRKALLRLPEAYRVVLVLRHYECLKFKEIADVLEIPEGTVKSRMSEALTQMHRLLRPILETRDNSNNQSEPKESLII